MHARPLHHTAVLMTGLTLALLAACGDGADGDKGDDAGGDAAEALNAAASEYVGSVEGSGALIAVSAQGGSLNAFVCGGSESSADYFAGGQGGEVTSASGATLDAEVSGEGASGTIIPPGGGEPLAFEASASPGSGLYEVIQGNRSTDGLSAADTELALELKDDRLEGTATPAGSQPIPIGGVLDSPAGRGTYVAAVDTGSGALCAAGTSEQVKQGSSSSLRFSASLGQP